MNLQDFLTASTNFDSVKDSVKDASSDFSDGYNRISLALPEGKKSALFKVRLLMSLDGTFGHGWERHVFQGESGDWIYAFCHNSQNRNNECPICAWNSRLWKSGEEGREKVSGPGDTSGTKRNFKFSYNVLVENDPITPENNGKILLLEVGLKIHGKIQDAINGDKESEVYAVNVFDMAKLPLLKIHAKIVSKQINFDSTMFDLSDTIALDTPEFFEKFQENAIDITKYINEKREEKTPDEILDRLRVVEANENIEGVKKRAVASAPVQVDSTENYQAMVNDGEFDDESI